MVRLASYLVADSVAGYRADHSDGDTVEAVFDPGELAEGVAFRQSIPSDLMALLRQWTRGFCPLNEIERSLSNLIDARGSNPVERTAAAVTAEDAIAMLEPGDADRLHGEQVAASRSPGTRLWRRGRGANTLNFVIEHALVIPFLYGQTYVCNEYCKYYKNVENPHYKFIPMVHRVRYDGAVSHVTGIVTITADEYDAMPKQFDGVWLRGNFPMSPSRWISSSTRSSRRHTASSSATSRSSGYPSTSTGRVMQPAASGPRRSRSDHRS